MEFSELVDNNQHVRCITSGLLQSQIAELRDTEIEWELYLREKIICDDYYQFIVNYDRSTNASERNLIINENPENFVRTLVHLLNKIETYHVTQYLLITIDDLFQEDKERVKIFCDYFTKIKDNIMDYFFSFLQYRNQFIVYQVSKIIAKFACWSSALMDEKEFQFFVQWIQNEFLSADVGYLETVVRNLQMVLRIRQYRLSFVRCGGIESICNALTGKLSSQIQYQLVFCLWCLSFDTATVQLMAKTPDLIAVVSDVIIQAEREKVIRISLAYFRFLIEKLDSQSKVREVTLSMVQFKVLRQLESLQQKDFSHDPELADDLTYVTTILSSNIEDVTSLEEYTIELKSGRLEWSPVHKTEKFWRENVEKFLEKNYDLLKMLIHLLETSKNPLTQQVAIHDIGEFVRHYPRGKQVIEHLGAKSIVMNFLNDTNSNVKYQALISVQKIMLHNWEYLGKQVDSAAN